MADERSQSTRELDLSEWHCPQHPEDDSPYFDGDLWLCGECGEPLESK